MTFLHTYTQARLYESFGERGNLNKMDGVINKIYKKISHSLIQLHQLGFLPQNKMKMCKVAA